MIIHDNSNCTRCKGLLKHHRFALVHAASLSSGMKLAGTRWDERHLYSMLA